MKSMPCAKWMTIKTFKQAETLISKGDPTDSLVFILSGLDQSLDDDQQVALYTQGDFAEDSFFQIKAPKISTSRESKTVLRPDSTHDFYEFLKRDQHIALNI